MKIHRDRTRGRTREAPFWWLLLVLWSLQSVLAAERLADGGGAWRAGWLVLAVIVAAVSLVCLIRARRRDRAADLADPPRL